MHAAADGSAAAKEAVGENARYSPVPLIDCLSGTREGGNHIGQTVLSSCGLAAHAGPGTSAASSRRPARADAGVAGVVGARDTELDRYNDGIVERKERARRRRRTGGAPGSTSGRGLVAPFAAGRPNRRSRRAGGVLPLPLRSARWAISASFVLTVASVLARRGAIARRGGGGASIRSATYRQVCTGATIPVHHRTPALSYFYGIGTWEPLMPC